MYDPAKRCWVLVLNKYQRDNLLWLMTEVIGYGNHPPVEPFGLLNTGDWVGEIAQALGVFDAEPPPAFGEDPGRSPNKAIHLLQNDVAMWLDRKRLDLLPNINYNETDGGNDESEEEE